MRRHNPSNEQEQLEKELQSDLGEQLFVELLKLAKQDREFTAMLEADAGQGLEGWDRNEDKNQRAKVHRLLPATERVLKRWLWSDDFNTVQALFKKARARCDDECEEFVWKFKPGRKLRSYGKLEIKFMAILEKSGHNPARAARHTEKLLKIAGYKNAKANSIAVRRSKV